MFLSGLFGKIAKSASRDIRVAIDIGSASIKTIVFEKKGDSSEITKKLVTQFPARENALSIVKFINNYIHDEVFKAIKSFQMIPQKIVIGFSGDFLENYTDGIKIERPYKTKNITEDEISEVFRNGVVSVEKGHPDKVVVDSSPVRVLIDGYEIKEVSGSMIGESLEVRFFVTLMRKEYWDQFKTLNQIFGGVPIKFVANQFVNASYIPKIFGADDVFLIDIGAKATELSLVEKGRLKLIHRFQSGGYDFTKYIAEALSIGILEAEDIKRQYEDLVLPPNLLPRVESAIAKSADDWERQFVETLLSDQNLIIPSEVYVFGGGLYMIKLQEFLKSGEWARSFSWRENINVSFISADSVKNSVIKETELKGYNEVSFLSLIYYSYLL